MHEIISSISKSNSKVMAMYVIEKKCLSIFDGMIKKKEEL